ncbi:unnamed protein product [Rhizophagus irregularis]|nr:unnamed protein product [Rhizophagus irregularis]
MLAGVKYHPKDFTAKVLNPMVSGGDLVSPASLADKNPYAVRLFEFTVSELSSYTCQEAAEQQGKKGKQKDQSNQHVSIETYANPVINKSMNIDDSADPSIAASQPNQKGNLRSTQSTSSTTTPIGQVQTIMIYDIPTAWSHDVILNKLTDWDKVLEISFKPQHKYQSVWTKMILWPIIDTNFVMRTWCQKLDDISVRWYLEHWKLKNCKERKRFQAKITIPSDAPKKTLKITIKGQTFADFVQKKA